MADLAKLVVKLEAESAKLHKDLDRSNKKLAEFQKSANKAGKALKNFASVGGAALVAASAAMGAMAKKTLDVADRVGKLSQSTGLSTETLSRLRLAADLTGGSFEAMAKGVGKLQRSMFDANDGLKAQSEAFEKLGVNVSKSDGSLRDTEAVMGDVAEQFSKMEDGAEKAALAQILFGRAGANMIPFLNAGKDGIAAMAKEADELGITMDSKLTGAAERTNDNLTRLSTAMEGVFLRVMTQAMPHIEAITKAMVAWSKEPNNVANALKFLGDTMKVIATGALVLKGIFTSLGTALGSVAAALTLAAQGEMSAAWEAIKSGASDSASAVTDAASQIQDVWTDTPKQIESKAPQIGKAIASPIDAANKQIGKTSAEIDKKLKEIQKKIESAQGFSKSLNEEFAGRTEKLTGAKPKAPKDLNVLDVSHLQRQAQKSLKGGDFEGAVEKARKAFDLLDKMKEAGVESDVVLKGMGERLRRLGQEIGEEKIKDASIGISIDQQAAIQSAMQANQAMQAQLSANPLTQVVNVVQNGETAAPTGINPDIVPNDSTKKPETKPNLQPVNITIPGGDTIPLYGDARGVDDMQRGIQREALKRGKR